MFGCSASCKTDIIASPRSARTSGPVSPRTPALSFKTFHYFRGLGVRCTSDSALDGMDIEAGQLTQHGGCVHGYEKERQERYERERQETDDYNQKVQNLVMPYAKAAIPARYAE